ncbi:flagellar hook protein FlgE [Erwinia sp. OLTSP20]|uniref:flagellar hook protein FlgE n=1 Tax=unclassified Erwinia TaxID=2622719 RepID=UPI000C176E78|nr:MULTISPECIES: flagellar hook protein FlgE [unclassified Erwinia]PIJ51922.1 flagellar hook protein FlgE [Erwinia sp. OAMSP11]PIJ74797.1 flagellar hook protein FlgE [Erwinia sp. OLSSP12]PIJ85183.1 flagellar hook protein FlgE [Erwinia sp. OLCASP19]PIJ87184.1 flagellar hook protein FlgE [Erwinia sp. OLMTSP26]PIJ88328.1 flagellar hook protein FlgE [Erwinia sp. OLMDSP33]
MSFSQAVSGLNAASSNLDVIGNNIANSATVGFKSSTIAFADMFAGSQVGLGTKVAAVRQNFADGATTTTSRGLDVAISQAGFFRMKDDSGNIYYSRNGQFTLNADRTIVNADGMALTGYPATGTPPAVQTGANPVALTIPDAAMAARATTSGALTASLNSSEKAPATAWDSTNISDSMYNAKSSMTAYDSLGNSHTVDLYFVKSATAENTWDVYPIDAATGEQSDKTTLTFNTSGQLTSSPNVTVKLGELNGSAPGQTFTLSMTGSTQQNTGSISTFGNPTQDGYKPGNLTSYQINDDGTVVGNYSNEKSQVLGQIVLANFANPEGLKPEGNNVWAATASSGQALVGLAGTGNLGTLTAGALESSNVDLSKELVNMIVAQRNYQSNAQTIKTQDQILNTLVNLR